MADNCRIDVGNLYKNIPEEVREELFDMIEESVISKRFDDRAKNLDILKQQTPEMLQRIKLDEVRNTKIRRNLVNEGLEHIKQGKTGSEVVENVLVGSTAGGKGTKASVSSETRTLKNRHMSAKRRMLDPHRHIIENKAHLPKLFETIDKINKGLDDVDPNYKEAAQAMIDFQKYLLNSSRKTGLNIKDRQDYIIRQTHSADMLITKGGKNGEVWIDDMLDNYLDIGKTFEEGLSREDMVGILKTMYDDIIRGGVSTQGAASLTKARKLHFKDGNALGNYHLKYSAGSASEVLDQTIASMAKAEGVYKLLGNNPSRMLDQIEDALRKEIKKTGDLKRIDAFDNNNYNKEGWKRREMRKEVIGRDVSPGRSVARDVFRAISSWNAVTKLGNSVFSTFTDMATTTVNYMAKTGEGFVTSFGKTLYHYTKNLGRLEKNELVGFLQMTEMFDSGGRFLDETTGVKGKLDRFTEKAMKLTLLDATTKVNRATSTTMFANHLATQAKKGFADLNPRLRMELESHGINAKDWDLIRGSATTVKGIRMVDPAKLLAGEGKNYDAGHKLERFLNHNGRFGAIAPMEATKVRMNVFGVDPNSSAGAFWSLLTQFKSFSLEATRAISEVVKSNPNADNATFLRALKDTDNLKILGALMTHSTGMAMLGLMARDIAAGKNPRDIDNGANWAEAFSRGVLPLSAGYMTEAVKGGYAGYGRGITRDLAGPFLSDVDDVTRIASSLFTEQDTKFKAARFVKKQTPFVNMMFVAPIINSAFMNSFNESMNKGYLKRQEKRNKEKGSESFMPDSFF